MARHSPRRLSAAVLATFVFGTTASAAELIGPAQVIDGGTIVIAGQRLVLDGLDAPALDRLCPRGGKNWRCGEQAAFALAAIIERNWLTCQTRKRQDLTTATCRMGGRKGIDIGEALVGEGWAKARAGSGYDQAERDAKQSALGLWAPR